MLKALKEIAHNLKKDLAVYRLALKDPRTPRLAKILLGIAVTYTTLPFDIIPDYVPLLGQVDDAIIIPVLIRVAIKLIPDEVMEECRVELSLPEVKARRKPRAKRRVLRAKVRRRV